MGVPNMKKFLILVILFLLVGCTKHDTRLLEEEILKAEEDTETEAEAEEIQVIKKGRCTFSTIGNICGRIQGK